MHWSSEWAEQHYDVSSTTSPPAHPKPLSYPQPSRPGFSGYSDDINALSASTLLKRYAERYSFSPAYPEPGTFRRSEPSQDAWSVGYSSEGLTGLEAVKGSLPTASNLSEQFSTGAISQDYTSTYTGPHLYHKPTYLPQPAFALPPTYPASAPAYTYPPSLTTPSSPSLLPSGIHTPTPLSTSLPSNHSLQPLKRPEEFQELPRNRKFGFDQPKTARVSPYAIRDSSDQPISDGIGNSSADLQNFRPDRLLSQPDLKVDMVRKTSHLQPLEAPSYGGPDQYTYH
ncbi:fidgetin-like protein 2 [Astyanax mexicanus]|uniref:Fidgetin like 2 n=2 Tax=Astyanax mexicanus TaxID=7994 RepID=A0A3B1IZ72_ASTMX|nr:fidgetin-like protein 2 [Astyanax mexicanus]KAG9277201.1 putative fidgetin-like protein 2 [Astyanax mexicanus]